jgi:hypothetical protein
LPLGTSRTAKRPLLALFSDFSVWSFVFWEVTGHAISPSG